MKTLLYTLSFVLVSTWGLAQIDSNSTRSNSFGDIQLRRYNGGDTTWKRTLVVGYDKSNKNSRLYINYGGDFNLGTRFNGPSVSIDGNLGVGTTTPLEKLDIRGNIRVTSGINNMPPILGPCLEILTMRYCPTGNIYLSGIMDVRPRSS